MKAITSMCRTPTDTMNPRLLFLVVPLAVALLAAATALATGSPV
jgi:hypothetical protein